MLEPMDGVNLSKKNALDLHGVAAFILDDWEDWEGRQILVDFILVSS
jgi:hypothetical protein